MATCVKNEGNERCMAARTVVLGIGGAVVAVRIKTTAKMYLKQC